MKHSQPSRRTKNPSTRRQKRHSDRRRYQLIVELDRADRQALEQLVELEQLSRADCVRRLIRKAARRVLAANRGQSDRAAG